VHGQYNLKLFILRKDGTQYLNPDKDESLMSQEYFVYPIQFSGCQFFHFPALQKYYENSKKGKEII